MLAEPVPRVKAEPGESNARYFRVVVAGPQDSLFEGGAFKLELFLPEEYPRAAPTVHFMTKMDHPNVDKVGRICLGFLKDNRSLALQVRTVLLLGLVCEVSPVQTVRQPTTRQNRGRPMKPEPWKQLEHGRGSVL